VVGKKGVDCPGCYPWVGGRMVRCICGMKGGGVYVCVLNGAMACVGMVSTGVKTLVKMV